MKNLTEPERGVVNNLSNTTTLRFHLILRRQLQYFQYLSCL